MPLDHEGRCEDVEAEQEITDFELEIKKLKEIIEAQAKEISELKENQKTTRSKKSEVKGTYQLITASTYRLGQEDHYEIGDCDEDLLPERLKTNTKQDGTEYKATLAARMKAQSKIVCDCGQVISRANKFTHIKTKNHIRKMEDK